MKKFDLKTLQAANLPRVQWVQIFTVKEGQLSVADQTALDDYFSHFTLAVENKCPGCESKLSGEEIMQAMGFTTFTWGIAHGEGFCRECGYPARAFHRNVGPIEFFNCILPYHPDELKEQP